MNWVYFLSLVSGLVLSVAADDSACCFSDTFSLDGKFEFHGSAVGRRNRSSSADIDGTINVIADFNNKRFTSQWSANVKLTGERNNETRDLEMKIIIDASRDPPTAYMSAKGFFKDPTTERCVYREVGRSDRIQGYQCAAKQVLRAGDVSDGKIRMYPERMHEEINNYLKIYFDQDTCTPVSVTLDELQYGPYRFRFRFDGQSSDNPDMESVFELPADMETKCRQGSRVNIGTVEEMKSLSMILLMGMTG